MAPMQAALTAQLAISKIHLLNMFGDELNSANIFSKRWMRSNDEWSFVLVLVDDSGFWRS